ncbi:MAG: glycine--tRNA ligase subunit beta [Oceanospirillaceae bacterium]|jgi:glycyl-tRNA synthetase beta chain|nr:glycine--tRNA ligase subunit beta [Oceanospirillaceae bacterium]MBT7331290.1 glycine--tRNA ligase subunit beta [Oceanospirillaceae bacterium]
MSHADFLFELGTEELPPKSLTALSNALESSIISQLKVLGLNHTEVISYATPRRLALTINQLASQQADRSESRRGPSVKAPEKAVEGFARSCKVSLQELAVVDTDKGQYYEFERNIKGAKTLDLLADVINKALAALPVAKRMRWGSSRNEFVRPVQWFILSLGNELIDTQLFGLTNGHQTRGHRFHSSGEFAIQSAATYAQQLRTEGHVVACFYERKAMIREQISEQASKLNATAVIDEKLLDEVTGLVEWPVCLTGRFDEAFLQVPAQALISSMKEHQKYFHFVDQDGAILPLFLTVSNIVSKDPAKIIEGNERVIRPRLADAMFFFDTDKKFTLESRNQALGKVVFQAQLGTVLDKTQRVAQLAGHIATSIGADVDLAQRAASLCKADLNTEMVLEFSDLQGLMGHVYALNDGEDHTVAAALEQHYWPKFAGDRLPQTDVASAVAIADRLDTLVGLFGIGQPPTGSKDPYALRRATVGLLRIIIENGYALDLATLVQTAYALHADLSTDEVDVEQQLLSFVFDRLRAYYDDQNVSVDIYLAVMANKSNSPLDFDHRVQAVNSFLKLESAQALAANNKRVSNILAKNGRGSAQLDPALLTQQAEIDLAQRLTAVQAANALVIAQGNYADALEQLAQLAEPLEAFFSDIMVMTDDETIKNNRLRLLSALQVELSRVADISLLAH